MRKSFRFWLIYSVAWLPVATSYFTLFRSHLGRPVFGSIKGSLFNVLPAALLGVGVIFACQRLPWSPNSRYRFLLFHLFLICLYLVLWYITPDLLNAFDQKMRYGTWPFHFGSSFQGGMITGLMFYLTLVGIVYAIQTNESLRAEQARAARAESLRTLAELEALRSQLNPHFLFNTLHSLMALVRRDPEKAEDALERLALLLRHTLMTTKNSEDVLLSQELDFVDNYLALEHLRLGDRLRVGRNIQAESLNCYLPPFTLQPLIENSIRHAIAPRPRGGSLQIKTERINGLLCLEILDDGPGAVLHDIEASSGIGVRTVRQRLMTRYGERAAFLLQTQPGRGFSVQMKIPVD